VKLKVNGVVEMEPQSYRDYALALADNGETQAALDSLYEMLKKPYSSNITARSSGIAEVAVTEINRLIAKNPGLNTSKIDKSILMNIPVDIRVVINWNKNNTDLDLHVVDPNNERCYFGNSTTRIGGRIGEDAREFAADGPSTVMAEIYTKYADKSEQRKVVSLQLSSEDGNEVMGKERAKVGEFEF